MGRIEKETNSEHEFGMDAFQRNFHMFVSTRVVVINDRAVRVGGDAGRAEEDYREADLAEEGRLVSLQNAQQPVFIGSE